MIRYGLWRARDSGKLQPLALLGLWKHTAFRTCRTPASPISRLLVCPGLCQAPISVSPRLVKSRSLAELGFETYQPLGPLGFWHVSSRILAGVGLWEYYAVTYFLLSGKYQISVVPTL
ncbi:hypothetical protein J6590_031469 [Homalodisca vitripennis]|nr:hypothetical protein J6590_031469 [Homalodisca vitripennis]